MKEDIKSDSTIHRQKAEELLKNKSTKTVSQLSEVEMLKLIHELEVYQIELELQNEELLLSRKEWIETFDLIPDMITILDSQQRIVRANKAAINKMGVSQQDAIGLHCHQWLHGKQKPPSFCPHAMMLNDGKEHIVDFHEEKLGMYLHVSLTPMFDNDGNFTGSVHIARDITEQKQKAYILNSLKKILQYNTDPIQKLLNFTLNEAIKLTESELGTIYYYDEKKHEFSLNSWSTKAMKESTIAESQTIYHLDKTGIWGEAVRQRKPIIVNDYQAANSFKTGYPDKHITLNKFLMIPVFSNKKIIAVVGVANKKNNYNEADILQLTLFLDFVWKVIELKRVESVLEEKNANLIEINAIKDTFFKIIAHDMKNPYISLLGASELLYENAHKYDINKIVTLSKLLNDSAKSGYDMLLNLLDWARSQAGSIMFHPEKINLRELTDKSFSNLIDFAFNKKINLNFDISSNIRVHADKNMLTTILRNLINNALKFTPKGGVVTVCSRNENDSVIIFVKDTGVGINQNDFDKLFRADIKYSQPGTDREGGTGLGLLLCKEFVEKHGGKIWVESEAKKGSIFYFNLKNKEQ